MSRDAHHLIIEFRRHRSWVRPVILLGCAILLPASVVAQSPRPAERKPALQMPVVKRPPEQAARESTSNLSAPRLVKLEGLSSPSEAWIEIRSGSAADFGAVRPGADYELPAGLVVQIYSAADWELQVLAPPHLEVSEVRQTVPVSRLHWRAGSSGPFRPFPGAGAVTVARGPRTGQAGRLVILELLLRLDNHDPLGNYQSRLNLSLQQKIR